jgi:hypothetical protein
MKIWVKKVNEGRGVLYLAVSEDAEQNGREMEKTGDLKKSMGDQRKC